MMAMLRRTLLIAVGGLFLLGLPPTEEASAGVILQEFPPIADCGTVGTVQSFFDLDGDGQLDECLVWFADSGGAWLVAGLEAFDLGDRIFVDGVICNTCLTSCPAGAILFATITECPGKPKGKKK